jgi:hypothetical protein
MQKCEIQELLDYSRNKNILHTQSKSECLPKNNNDPKAEAPYIKYCKIPRNVKKLRSNTTVDL